MEPLEVVSRVNPVDLANKSCKKLETLTDTAHTRTVRTVNFCPQHMLPCLLVEVDEPKAYELSLMKVTGFFNSI
jgi:hypothetical protein